MPPPPGLLIRVAETREADTVADLHVRSWRSAYRGFAPDDWLDSPDLPATARDYWRAAFASDRPGLVTWLAVLDGVPVGFANIAPAPASPQPGEEVPVGCGYLHHIHLAPESVGRGIGAALFRAASMALREQGFTEAVLWVYAPNARARAFYEAMGWRHDGMEAPHAFPSAAGPVIVPSLRYRGVTVSR